MTRLPDHVHHADCACYRPVGNSANLRVSADQQQPQIVHIHQAAPDRTVQRLAVGAGMGAGAVAGAVVLGPMVAAAFASIAVTLAVTAVVVATAAWAVVTVIRSVGGKEGTAAVDNVKALKRQKRGK